MSELDYGVFMRGLCNAHFDVNKCAICGGTGFKAITCCGGLANMCGCMGAPVDFVDCDNGCKKLSDDQIKSFDLPPTNSTGG